MNASADNAPHYDPVVKADGVNASEKYLASKCQKTFLSLWSYPGVYRDQGKPQNGGHGKEICDLLVVFGDHIIIFSDKHCHLKDSGNVSLDWKRWFKKSIQRSAEQTFGAERWIRQYPTRVFLDRGCTKTLPIPLPRLDTAHFHLVVVAHGISTRIRKIFGGSGSLMINTTIKGFDQHTEPFYVGDLVPRKTFVHVVDDDSLDTLMATRDTISDFVHYLSKREQLLRGQRLFLVTGEEQLLAIYLTHQTPAGEHDFVFPNVPDDCNLISLAEGHWEDFQRSPQRLEQIRQDHASYAWDRLIEKFTYYAMRGEQYYVTAGGLTDTEKILRFMAREPRWIRRYLAQSLVGIIETTPPNIRMLRVIPPHTSDQPYYVFLLFPLPTSPTISQEKYRTIRRVYLSDCCRVVKLKFPDAKDIVGIATESGNDYPTRSEDAVYVNVREWTAEMENEAKKVQNELDILTSEKEYRGHVKEYPDIPRARVPMQNPRNKPCPCGSGKKYKHCCLNKKT